MEFSKKYFNSCTLYIILWLLYHLQGTLYASGSIISQGLLAMIMLLSCYYVMIVNSMASSLPKFFKVLNVFLLMITAYGIVALLDPTPLYYYHLLDASASKFEFLKTAYMSLLPIYVFYYFYKNGLLTEHILKSISIILLVVTTFSFIRMQNDMLLKAMSMRSMREEFTNNIAYDFLHLLPMAFFWHKKPIVQYLLATYIFVFLVVGMKRGAMLIGALCLIYFMYRTWKSSNGKQRLVVSVLTIAIVIVGIDYVSDFYANSDYFQYRMEKTAEGDSSGRDEIYATLWNHFLNEKSVTKIIFGNGAMQTIRIAGNYAHNDWLEILTCHGLLGIFIYILYFVVLIKSWLRSRKNPKVYSMLGMLILIMFSSTIFSMSYNNLSLSMTICLGYCMAQFNHKKMME